MNDQDRKAREMLAEEYDKDGRWKTALLLARGEPAGKHADIALRAIRRALELAAPAGFVAVQTYLLREAADSVKASTAEVGITEDRREYRADLAHRLMAAIPAAPKPAATEAKPAADGVTEAEVERAAQAIYAIANTTHVSLHAAYEFATAALAAARKGE